MTDRDPFVVLGLAAASATERELRAARRRLAKEIHPDRGGDAGRMSELNRAYERALAQLRQAEAQRREPPAQPIPPPKPPSAKTRRPGRFVERDDASFAVSVLPVEAFEALVVAANSMGQVLLDDPPYLLECYLRDPVECFCRLELFPEGGGSQVAVTVVTAEGGSGPPPSVDDVRDAFIAALSAF
ncbi:MAG: hypothetical protein ABJD24_06145 [Acidimicrobiales bacterium]